MIARGLDAAGRPRADVPWRQDRRRWPRRGEHEGDGDGEAEQRRRGCRHPRPGTSIGPSGSSPWRVVVVPVVVAVVVGRVVGDGAGVAGRVAGVLIVCSSC